MPLRRRPEVLCVPSTSEERDLSSRRVIAIASPIVVIIKKNEVDIRLCIDYRLLNSPDDLPNALNQRPTRSSGVNTLVLFFGYGEWVLGGENDGPYSLNPAFITPLGYLNEIECPSA
ncbi:LOW QUALITY PROTEIN: hypothetical protein PHMEG_00015158 [Phytophthora megakarya]|uniref:Reverse transcriptase n=1 Tax=Phytophthora megakarya TaxID=4795 RepID=A0A225W2J8_9STRA|nr:LOW QUALITY PROTEIN: hypothetical protein PHMEG_00015158 [Phytophthora megakarya]